MEPPTPPRGIGVVSHSQAGSGRSSLASTPSTPSSVRVAAMANAAVSVTAPRSAYASPHHQHTHPQDAKPRADEPSTAGSTVAARPPANDLVRLLVTQLGDSVAAALQQVATQYGVVDALSSTLETDDARGVAQELQRARRRAAELQLLVDDLQTEQRVARERLALYSILALKLKRELINEKLAHIDSKKEVDEVRQQYESAGSARSPDAADRARLHARMANDQRRGSYESLRGGTHSAEEDDPWSSPNKPTTSTGDAFGSFYSQNRGAQARPQTATTTADHARGSANDDEEDDDERMMGMQPLRNSLIGQFLPSALLDSPQLTPKARSEASGSRSVDTQDEDDTDEHETKVTEVEDRASKAQAELQRDLSTFTLRETEEAAAGTKTASCDGCGRSRAPVVELVECGHRLCRPCDRMVSPVDEPTSPSTTRQCPRCFQSVATVRRLDKGDNQMDHLRIETSRPSSSDSTSTALSFSTPLKALTTAGTAGSGSTATTVAPLTLSLLSEMFENIPVDELEQFLKEANGQVSGAIERILQRHPSFNPALAAEVAVMAGPGAGSGGQKGAPGSLHRSGSSGVASHQQQSQQQGGASGNWKTEMCMYYLQGKCNKTRRTCSFAHGESDLVRTNTPKHTSSTSYKSRMCPLWLEGSCPKSRRECPLAHGENDLRDGLALLGQNAGGAGAGAGAGALPAPTLPTTAPRLQNYKTELCYYYLKGCCNFTKEECRFAHGESDLRTVESNTLEWSAQLGAATGLPTEKPSVPHQHSHQYLQQQQQQPQPQQQQYVSQYQPQPQQQPLQQPAMQPHQQYGLTPLPAPFVPQQVHQYHQMAPQAMHAHQMQGPVPPALQQGPYAGHQPQYRYMKSMDDAKPPRRPAPPRRESTWSQPSYDSLGPDF